MRITPAVLEGLEHQGFGGGGILFGLSSSRQFSSAFSDAFRSLNFVDLTLTAYVSGSGGIAFGGSAVVELALGGDGAGGVVFAGSAVASISTFSGGSTGVTFGCSADATLGGQQFSSAFSSDFHV